MVAARSAEDTPVVVPRTRSTDTVNAVRCDSLLSGTICGSSSRASRCSSIDTQMMPLVWRIMKATACGRGALGRHDEITLVLPVLVVHDDDHAPGAQLGEQLLDGAERCIRGSSLAVQGQDFGHAACVSLVRHTSIPEPQ